MLKWKRVIQIILFDNIDNHYAVAWEIVENAFNDPVPASNKKTKALSDLPTCTKAMEKSIRSILDTATKHYRTLEASKKPFLAFPMYAIVNKLDEQTRRKWKEFNKGNNFPTKSNLLEFLNDLHRVFDEDIEKAYQFFNDNKIKQPQTSFSAIINSQTSICGICKNAHYINCCPKFSDISSEDRYTIVKDAQ